MKRDGFVCVVLQSKPQHTQKHTEVTTPLLLLLRMSGCRANIHTHMTSVVGEILNCWLWALRKKMQHKSFYLITRTDKSETKNILSATIELNVRNEPLKQTKAALQWKDMQCLQRGMWLHWLFPFYGIPIVFPPTHPTHCRIQELFVRFWKALVRKSLPRPSTQEKLNCHTQLCAHLTP